MSEGASRRRYLRVWGGLALLTVLEVALAKSGAPRLAALVGLMAMGLWKALLVALYFMHLGEESRWLKAAAVVPAALSGLAVALLLTDTPLFGRFW